MGTKFPGARLLLLEDTSGVSANLIGTLPPPILSNSTPEKPISLVLTNALLKTSPLQSLALTGKLDGAAPLTVQSGELDLKFELYLILRRS